MNAGPTSERVYIALKARLLSNGFPPGAKLDPTLLASDLISSVTPVRDALHLLTGERLVDSRTSDGFYLTQVHGPGLEDLYAWNAEVLLASLRQRAAGRAGSDHQTLGRHIAERTAELFASIAASSSNGEHRLAVGSINDRLSAVRYAEAEVIDDAEDELERIIHTLDDTAALRKAIVAYHRIRRRRAPEIVRALYRAG